MEGMCRIAYTRKWPELCHMMPLCNRGKVVSGKQEEEKS